MTPAGVRQTDLTRSISAATAARFVAQAAPVDPRPLLTLVQQAVDAARSSGAQYADARFTRTVGHAYAFGDGINHFAADAEILGFGVRALIDGYWGFAAGPWHTPEIAVRLARDAVAQAVVNAKGLPRSVDLGHYPVATGSWTTPIHIDPFDIPIEEKRDFFRYWMDYAERCGVSIGTGDGGFSFIRQEQAVATSEGTLFTQTRYESAGAINVRGSGIGGSGPNISVQGLEAAGKGWELILDAKIPEQLERALDKIKAVGAIPKKPFTVGRYTLVCDGATMAALVDRTLGAATQLDRALGYEANARGTSFLDDPLGMLGTFRVAAPTVTVTANRSTPAQLATVKWDDEGVEPHDFTLIKDGVLVDYQTTREQAAWLAPYYAHQGQQVRSHGCAASEDSLGIPLQMMPNLAMEPSPHAIRLEDLVADVTDGILLERGDLSQVDFQARTGILAGAMREIKNGRVGRALQGGGILFNTLDLWRRIIAVGGPGTQGSMVAPRGHNNHGNDGFMYGFRGIEPKGQPPQTTSYSTQAVAAVIPNQSLIDLARKI